MTKYNTEAFSIANTKTATLEEKQSALYELLYALSKTILPNYHISEESFGLSPEIPTYKSEKQDYLNKIKQEISQLNSKEIDKHFNQIWSNFYSEFMKAHKIYYMEPSERTSMSFMDNQEENNKKEPSYNVYYTTRKEFHTKINQHMFSLSKTFTLLQSYFEDITNTIFDYYGFIPNFEARKKQHSFPVFGENLEIVPHNYLYSKIKSALYEYLEKTDIFSKIAGHCSTFQETFNEIKKLPPCFYNEKMVSNLIVETPKENNIEYLDFIYSLISSNTKIATHINNNQTILTSLNEKLNNENFEKFQTLMPALGQFYSNFDFSENAVQEPEFSKTYFYFMSKMGKELGINKDNYALCKYLVESSVENYNEYLSNNKINGKIISLHVRQGQLAVIINGESEENLKNLTSTFKTLINKAAHDIFIKNILDIKNKGFSTASNLVKSHVKHLTFSMDVDLNCPINPENKVTNTIKF